MSDRADVVIVGAGQAGAQAAIALRQQKFDGSILVLGREQELPYERPALSKEYLAGEKAFEKLLLRPPAFWTERKVEMRLGQPVTTIDANAHTVHTADGRAVAYGRLVWAAGGRPRRLRGTPADLRGLHTIRGRTDVDALRGELETNERVVIIGAGYIGLEAAAVLRKMGKHVTVLEGMDRVLARVAGVALSRFFEAEHRAHGVELRLGAQVAAIEEKDGRAYGVRLVTGEILPADLVIVGIGIAPEMEPLVAAGAAAGDGVLVDLHGKTSLEDIYAVGDCAAHPNVHASGRVVRLESVQNAIDQATIVAKSIAGTLAADERYDAVPWFWSNQYDVRLQTVGLFQDHDEVVVRGEQESRTFSVVYLRRGAVIALDCVNRTKDYVQGKALIASRHEVDRARLADANLALKELLSPAPA